MGLEYVHNFERDSLLEDRPRRCQGLALLYKASYNSDSPGRLSWYRGPFSILSGCWPISSLFSGIIAMLVINTEAHELEHGSKIDVACDGPKIRERLAGSCGIDKTIGVFRATGNSHSEVKAQDLVLSTWPQHNP